MIFLKRICIGFIVVLTTIISVSSSAQGINEQSDIMRSNGKIYVVMAVVLIILFGLFAYLISVDRKIGKVEKERE